MYKLYIYVTFPPSCALYLFCGCDQWLRFLYSWNYICVFVSFCNPFPSLVNWTPQKPTVKGKHLLILGNNLASFVKYSYLLSSKKNSLYIQKIYYNILAEMTQTVATFKVSTAKTRFRCFHKQFQIWFIYKFYVCLCLPDVSNGWNRYQSILNYWLILIGRLTFQ